MTAPVTPLCPCGNPSCRYPMAQVSTVPIDVNEVLGRLFPAAPAVPFDRTRVAARNLRDRDVVDDNGTDRTVCCVSVSDGYASIHFSDSRSDIHRCAPNHIWTVR